jgi:DNA-directed RNA polymerase subunit omega
MSVEQTFDSNFRYVLVAARRARQLQNGSTPLVPTKSSKACRIAQEEIAAGKIAYVKGDTPVVKPEVAGAEIPRFAIS